MHHSFNNLLSKDANISLLLSLNYYFELFNFQIKMSNKVIKKQNNHHH